MNIQSNIMFANEFLEFLNEGCTAFHAVDATISRLENAGFTCLLETDVWNLSLGGKYYFTRNNSTVFAFTIGGKYQPGNGYTVLGAHTDRCWIVVYYNFNISTV
jgi:aspartyl aminopeptidase